MLAFIPAVLDDRATMDLSTLTTERYQQFETAELMRTLSALACAHGESAAEYYTARWGGGATASIVRKAFDLHTKAAVPPGTTTDDAWGGALITSRLSGGFLAQVRRASVIGQLAVTPTPFETPMTHQISGASLKWIGQGAPKPVTKVGLQNLGPLAPTKCGGIVVVTTELMRLARPGSEQALQTLLVNELVSFSDAAFLGTAAATAVSPAGLLNGVTASADLAATIAALFTARPNAMPTWIVAPAKIGALSGVDVNVPTTLMGYPIVQSPAAGANAILVDAPAIAVADGGVELDTSNEAAVELVDNPAVPTAATVYTSLWVENLVGIRLERFLNWQAAAGAVAYTATLT